MPRKRYSVEEIIEKLREAEVALGQGATVEEVIRRLGISEPTYYRWRREYGGLQLRPGEATQRPGTRERAPEEARGGAGPR